MNTFCASRRIAGGLSGYAPRLDQSRPFGVIPDACGLTGLRASLANSRTFEGGLGGLLPPSPYHGVLAVNGCALERAGVLVAVYDP